MNSCKGLSLLVHKSFHGHVDRHYLPHYYWALLAGVVSVDIHCQKKYSSSFNGSKTTRLEASNNNNNNKDDDSFFDVSELWKNQGSNSVSLADFWNKISGEKDKPEPEEKKEDEGIVSKLMNMVSSSDQSQDNSNNKSVEPSKDIDNISQNFLNFITGSRVSSETITDIVAKLRNRSGEGDVEDTTTLTEIFNMLYSYKDALGVVADKYLKDIDFTKLTPTALLYYLEYQEQIQTPSWKRRMHRFCRGIDMAKVDEVYKALILGELSYADSVEDIRKGLENHPTPYELVYCTVKSSPGQPANFVAVQRDQPSGLFDRNILRVVLVVRGTKSIADILTDLLCDTEEYQGGKVHSFILNSGRYIAEKHRDLLLDLLELSGKSKIHLKIVGHSLGAGAASIAGMELHAWNDPRIQVEVVGFGCPSIVSKELAEQADYITTVINDADVVPRMSGPSVANLLLDILDFDWSPFAKNDVHQTLMELQKLQPIIFTSDVVKLISDVIDSQLDQVAKDASGADEKDRAEVDLFPPGKCVHFYRDGINFSASYVPNTFFSEIEVSRRMIDDHLFHSGYQKTFLEVVRTEKRDHHFQFSADKSLPVDG